MVLLLRQRLLQLREPRRMEPLWTLLLGSIPHDTCSRPDRAPLGMCHLHASPLLPWALDRHVVEKLRPHAQLALALTVHVRV